MSDEDKIYVNGINVLTGDYLIEPMEFDEIASFALGEKPKSNVKSLFKMLVKKLTKKTLGLPTFMNPNDLHQTGWGIIFHTDEADEIKTAFDPLIQHRLQQVGDPNKVKIFDYINGEDYLSWIARNHGEPGIINPNNIPYYLLLVGSPEHIPYEFGFHLDGEYAIGRLHFDHVEQYEQYVASLKKYDDASILSSVKEAVFFATRHNFDRSTTLSADNLASPLIGLKNPPGVAEQAGFQSRYFLGNPAPGAGDPATKKNLKAVFCPRGDGKNPSFVFTASHGIGWPVADLGQKENQGALVCQDWPGFGSMDSSYYFAATDLPVESQLNGMITFHFACFSAGTPKYDRFVHKPNQPPPQLANEAFIAGLPKAMLSHSNGGCLACVGHVERAWGYSISPTNGGPSIQVFQDLIISILQGVRLGHAMTNMNSRYLTFSNNVIKIIENSNLGINTQPDVLAKAWVQRNDAEGYLILGDPAVRLRVENLVHGLN
jgi:hypothetical protein